MKTWWQVYDYPKIWGFCSRDGIIVDVPYDYSHLKFKRLDSPETRNWFINNNLKVVKIADVNE